MKAPWIMLGWKLGSCCSRSNSETNRTREVFVFSLSLCLFVDPNTNFFSGMYLSIYRLPIYVLDNSLTKYHVMPTSAPSIYVDQINENI